mmetsp:Transcript_25518/g.69228  ORF Transcript_25518/g.69228 Transcript_25518/m.69228 type:complete len:302 (-) Transcript_25518:3258-4163(-)
MRNAWVLCSCAASSRQSLCPPTSPPTPPLPRPPVTSSLLSLLARPLPRASPQLWCPHRARGSTLLRHCDWQLCMLCVQARPCTSCRPCKAGAAASSSISSMPPSFYLWPSAQQATLPLSAGLQPLRSLRPCPFQTQRWCPCCMLPCLLLGSHYSSNSTQRLRLACKRRPQRSPKSRLKGPTQMRVVLMAVGPLWHQGRGGWTWRCCCWRCYSGRRYKARSAWWLLRSSCWRPWQISWARWLNPTAHWPPLQNQMMRALQLVLRERLPPARRPASDSRSKPQKPRQLLQALPAPPWQATQRS